MALPTSHQLRYWGIAAAVFFLAIWFLGDVLLPFIVGVLMLFMDGRSKLGWLLLLAGVVIILVGILMNLRIYFEPTSLFNTLLMLVLLFGGIGLIARSLKSV